MEKKIYQRTNIVFPISEDRYLLGMKKRGFGVGWWNGFGGKLEPGETYEDSARRETFEEVGVTVDKLKHIASIVFYNEDQIQAVSKAYTATFHGEPAETEEMKPEYFKLKEFPYSTMWPGDDNWIPEALENDGKPLGYIIHFDKDNNFKSIEKVTTEAIEENF
jgi:8-oxo-dGTP diphosphatase/2-hydroxy-dATP diphosphatase